ncbi:hypothetical protein Tco_0199561 [Tanacetum coccineum]
MSSEACFGMFLEMGVRVLEWGESHIEETRLDELRLSSIEACFPEAKPSEDEDTRCVQERKSKKAHTSVDRGPITIHVIYPKAL